jgi:uncharacterized protein YukE
MKTISKADQKRIEALIGRLSDAGSEVATAIDALKDALNAANEVRQELYDVMDDICNTAEGYYDERSEKWQEGDAGSAYQSWITQLETSRDALETEFDADVENPVEDVVNEFEGNIQTSVDG